MSTMPPGARADEPATEVITALAILNREGNAPEAAGRSARAQHRKDADPEGEPDERGVARNGAIAGGALLAGGAAVGVALFAGSEPPAGETALAAGGGEGAYPGQGLLDPEVSAEAPPEPVAIDPAASTGTLDHAAPVVPQGTGTPAREVGAPAASPDSSSHAADSGDSGGTGGTGGGDDTAFGSGSGPEPSGDDTADDDTADDTADADEGGLLGLGGDEGVLDTGLMASGSESPDDEPESGGGGDGGDDGGSGLLDTGLIG